MIELSESKVDKRQLKALLRAAWKTDLRGSSNPMNTAGRSTKFPPIVGVLLMQALVGAGMAALTFFVKAPFISAFFVFSTMTVFLALIVLLEFSNLILSPDDYMIVSTQPVGSKTFFVVKQIHLLVYVNALGMVIYAPSAVTAAIANQKPLLFISFFFAGLMAATTIGMSFVLLYTLLLRIVNRETMQRVLGYSQLVLTILIYFGYFVVPRMYGKQSLMMLQNLHSNWLFVSPSAWFAAIAKVPAGGLTIYDSSAIVLAIILLFSIYRTGVSRLSLGYAQTLSSTVAQQEQMQSSRKLGLVGKLMMVFANHEDRAIWSLIRKQFKYDNRFKMSILTILPLTALYVYLGIADGKTTVNPFQLVEEANSAGTSYLLYVAVSMLPFMVTLGTSFSESYRSAWVFYTSPADRSRIILASARFALTYFCFPFTLMLVGLFTWFFGNLGHALLHCLLIFVILMVLTKLMVLVYPRVPFSQPTKAGQRSISVFVMLLAGMPLMLVPMIIVSKYGYGGYGGYAIYLGCALLINYLLLKILKSTIPKRASKLEFTAPV